VAHEARRGRHTVGSSVIPKWYEEDSDAATNQRNRAKQSKRHTRLKDFWSDAFGSGSVPTLSPRVRVGKFRVTRNVVIEKGHIHLVTINNSFLLTSSSFRAAPTLSSLPYLSAQSICRNPSEQASFTSSLTSSFVHIPSGLMAVPNPSTGTSTPLLHLMVGIAIELVAVFRVDDIMVRGLPEMNNSK
jgi:hypothetical protein